MYTKLYFKFFGSDSFITVTQQANGNVVANSYDPDLLRMITELHNDIFKRAFTYINNEDGCCGVEYDCGVTDGLQRCAVRADLLKDSNW